MNKKLFIGASAFAVALALGTFAGVRSSAVRTDAASLKDAASHYETDFKTLDEDKWAAVGTNASEMYKKVDETVVEAPHVSFTGFSANSGQAGYLRTENMISLGDGKSLIVEIEGSDWTDGWIVLQALRTNDPELATVSGLSITKDGQATSDGGAVPGTTWTGIGSPNFHSRTKLVMVVNPDGSGRVDIVTLAGEAINGIPGTAFTNMPFEQEGYWGLEGFNSFCATIRDVRIGQQNADGTEYEQLFQANLVKGQANMADHGNVLWGGQTVTFADVRIQSTGYVQNTGFNYNDGWYTTKSPVTIPTGKTIYYEVDVKDWVSGSIGFTGVESAYAWPSFFDITAESNMVRVNVGTVVFPVTSSGWCNIFPSTFAEGATFRVAINPDGTGKFGIATAGGAWADESTGLALVANMTGMHYATTGYVSLYGNGGSDYKLEGFRIGYADDADMTNAAVVRGQNFRYETPSLFENKLVGASSASTVTAPVYGTEIHKMTVNNPEAGTGLVYTGDSIEAGEGKLAEVSVTVDGTLGSGSKLGLAVGASNESVEGATLVEVAVDGETASLNGTAVNVAMPATLKAVVYNDKVVATLGEISVEIAAQNVNGNVAIVGEGTIDAELVSFSYDEYTDVDRLGRNYDVSSFNEDNYKWFYHAGASEDYTVADGKVTVEGHDGDYFGTKESYANWELETDFEYKYDSEEEVIKSVWAGIVFGKEVDYSNCAWAGDTKAPFIYFNNTCVDYLNLPVTRSWTSADNNPMQQGVNHVKIRAEDGHLQFWFNHEGQDPVQLLDLYDVDTVGKIAFTCTAGSNYSIDSFKITNLDHPEDVAPTDTTSTKAYSVVQGETVEGSITGQSGYEGGSVSIDVDASQLDGKGTFAYDAATGKFTFAANEDCAVGTYTVSYVITDEDVSTSGSVTIAVTEKQSGGEGGDDNPDEPDEPSEDTKKRGCGGSIVATSGLLALVSGVGVALALGKKKED